MMKSLEVKKKAVLKMHENTNTKKCKMGKTDQDEVSKWTTSKVR